MHEVAAAEALDLARGREEAGVADGAVALHALAEAGVLGRAGRDARVAGHAVEEVLGGRGRRWGGREKKTGPTDRELGGEHEGRRESAIRTAASTRKVSRSRTAVVLDYTKYVLGVLCRCHLYFSSDSLFIPLFFMFRT